jgi:hypothetical protein
VINYLPHNNLGLWRSNTEEEIETRHLGDNLLLNTSSPTWDVRKLAWLSYFFHPANWRYMTSIRGDCVKIRSIYDQVDSGFDDIPLL